MFEDLIKKKEEGKNGKEIKIFITCISCNRQILKGRKCPWCNPINRDETGDGC